MFNKDFMYEVGERVYVNPYIYDKTAYGGTILAKAKRGFIFKYNVYLVQFAGIIEEVREEKLYKRR